MLPASRQAAIALGVAGITLLATACGTSRTTTVMKTRTLTTTVTETVVRVVQKPAPTPIYVPESGGRLLLEPREIVTGVSGGQIFFDHWRHYGDEYAEADARFEMN